VFADPPYDVAAADIEEMLVALVTEMGGRRHSGGCRAPNAGPPLNWPDGWRPWPSAATATPAWSWPSGLTSPDSVDTHERRRMPRIV